MLVSRHISLPWETLKWLAILTLALLAAVVFARQLASADGGFACDLRDASPPPAVRAA